MTRIYNFCKKAMITAIYFIIFLVVALTPINAWALDYDLLESEFNGWAEVDDVVLYDDADLCGSLKKIIDAKNGCVYIYFQLTDNRIKNTPIENLIINFTVKNSENSYTFSVNRDGMLNEGASEKKAIKLAQNINKRSTYFYGFIGFELTQRSDRRLDNTISCSYSNGMSEEYFLLKNVGLNMYSENKTDAKKSTKNNSTSKAVKASKSPSKTKASSNTKFEGENKYHTSRKDNYADSENFDDTDNIGEELDFNQSFANTDEQVFTNSEINDFKERKTNAEQMLKSVSIGSAFVGSSLIIYGVIINVKASKMNNISSSNKVNSEENELNE